MNSTTAFMPGSLPAFEILDGEILPLQPEDYTQALAISDQVNTSQQWQTYLNQLALAAVSTWLQEWAGDLTVQSRPSSPKSSASDPGLEPVCQLQVGEFNWCLLVTESLIDGKVTLPEAILDSPDLAAHFYVVIEVWEAQHQASIRGFLRYNQLQQLVQTTRCPAGQYQLPLARFEPQTRYLLRDLHLGQAAAFGLPQPTSSGQIMGTPIINIAQWLQDEIDDVTRRLGWGVPAPLAPAYAAGWRSTDPFNDAIATLLDRGMAIPPQARGSCQTFALQEIPLQLLVAAWQLPTQSALAPKEDTPETGGEWSLLVIIGTQSGNFLPSGLQLQVRDQTQVLSDQILDSNDLYLVAHVIGTPDDQFDVTITLDCQQQQLESFIFVPTANSSHSEFGSWN